VIKQDKKNVILLETGDQVRYSVKNSLPEQDQTLNLALTPLAAYELERLGMPHRLIEDCYPEKDLYRFGIENYERIETLCNTIDEHLIRGFPDMKKTGIRPAIFNLYNIKLVFDPVSVRLYQLLKMTDCLQPEAIYLFTNSNSGKKADISLPPYLFDDEVSIFSALLKLPFWNAEIKPIVTEAPAHSDVIRAHKNIIGICKKRLMNRVRNNATLYAYATAYKHLGWPGVMERFKKKPRPSQGFPVLLYGAGYNWDSCGEKLRNADIHPIFRVLNDDRQWIQGASATETEQALTVWRDIKKDAGFRKEFVFNHIDCFPVLEGKLKYFAVTMAPSCLKTYTAARRFIAKRDVKAFITSNLSSCFDHTYAKAARDENIPVVSWQHGGSGTFQHPILSHMDMMSADVVLSFGQGTIQHQLKPANPNTCKLIPIGSSCLDALYKENRRRFTLTKQMKILYFPTHLNLNQFYISGMPPFSDNRIWHTIRRITDLLGKHQTHETIIKLHPAHVTLPPINQYLEENKIRNVQLAKGDTSLKRLLSASDLIIVDLATTILLQALTTRLPVFVFSGNLYLDNDARKMLEKRAYCYEQLDQFTKNLDLFLSGNTAYEKDLYDTEFLRNFGMHEVDCDAGSRAVKALQNIICHGIDPVDGN
jgi:hypothetical protein